MTPTHWLDRLLLGLAPTWTLRRLRARAAAQTVLRHYEAASTGYRTKGWLRTSTDPNAAVSQGIPRLRDATRDLVRNNAYGEAALSTIVDHAVGTGIVAKPAGTVGDGVLTRAGDAWKAWADTTACDAEGRLDFPGLQKQIMRTVVESGEVLVRRRTRLPEDGLPIPMQLQVLEPDYLDTLKDEVFATPDGVIVRRIIQGVEFDAIGRRVAYWLFPEHPGSTSPGGLGASLGTSKRVLAEDILHVFRPGRPGQVRGVSWFAPVLLRLKDLDEFEDAALMKQKIAACLAVLVTDPDGTSAPLGASPTAQPELDMLSPGMISNIAPGRQVTVVDPPSVSEHTAYVNGILRAVAAGIGVTFEDITGDYGAMPFSAARMSRLRHWARVDDWRWRMLIPQFCDPVWRWAMEAAKIMGVGDVRLGAPLLGAEWTCPPPAMIDPDTEAQAYKRLIRIGAITWDEMVRERGYDPDAVQAEMVARNRKWDAAGIVLDCDPRQTTEQGQAQAQPKETATADSGEPAMAASANGNGNGYHP